MEIKLLQARATRVLNRLVWNVRHLRARRTSGTSELKVVRSNVPGYGSVWEYTSDSFVENEFGFIMDANGDLWEESLVPNFGLEKAMWRIAVPGPFRIDKMRSNPPPKVRYYEEVVSIRHLWEWNYYHFFMDVLPQLQILEQAGYSGSYPVVIGGYANELRWTSEVLNMGSLANREWIIQDDFLVSAKRVLGAKVTTAYGDRMSFVQKLLDAPTPVQDSRRRVFLVRAKGTSRSLVNHDDATSLLGEYGFEVVDTAAMSVAEQQKVFSETRHLVALHGAGMTNMIFRYGAPMSVLELHGHSHVSQDFKRMAEAAGWHFDRLSGPANDGDYRHVAFSIDLPELRERIVSLLKN